jgi:hypothetical protein
MIGLRTQTIVFSSVNSRVIVDGTSPFWCCTNLLGPSNLKVVCNKQLACLYSLHKNSFAKNVDDKINEIINTLT